MKKSVVLVGFLVCVTSSLASAKVTIRKPTIGTRVEPGENVVVQFDIDANSRGDEYNSQISVKLRTSPDDPYEHEQLFPNSVLNQDPALKETSSSGSRDGTLTWVVPDVTCTYCELLIQQVPGRGDYDSDGTVTLAVGADYKIVVPDNAGSGSMGGQPMIDPSKELPGGQLAEPAPEDLGSGEADPGASKGVAGCSMVHAPADSAVWASAIATGVLAALRSRRRSRSE